MPAVPAFCADPWHPLDNVGKQFPSCQNVNWRKCPALDRFMFEMAVDYDVVSMVNEAMLARKKGGGSPPPGSGWSNLENTISSQNNPYYVLCVEKAAQCDIRNDGQGIIKIGGNTEKDNIEGNTQQI